MKKVLLLLALMCFTVSAYATTTSGTVTVSQATRYRYEVVTWDWASDASGIVVDNTASVVGEILRVTFEPDSGSTSPTASYDVDIEDQNGVNILLGLGDNRSQSASESLFFDIRSPTVFSTSTLVQAVDTNCYYYPWRMLLYGTLTLKITNAGDEKAGKIRLYVKRY